MQHVRLRRSTLAKPLPLALCLAALCGSAGRVGAAPDAEFDPTRIRHVIVIFQENWSFDGLFSQFPGADGVAFGTPVRQVDQTGAEFKQMDLPVDALGNPYTSPTWTGSMPVVFHDLAAFDKPGNPFVLGSHTADVTHRFVHHKLQIGRGGNEAFLYLSDLKPKTKPQPGNFNSLCLSAVDATKFPAGTFVHDYAGRFVLCDRCFQSAYGGSFLNHQFLVAAATPIYPGALAKAAGAISKPLPASGLPVTPGAEWDRALLADPVVPGGADHYAVNTLSPPYRPSKGTGDGDTLPPQTHETIANRLDAAGLSWAWYAEYWNENAEADGAHLTHLFQPHHPFNYFERFDPVTHPVYRAQHLQDLEVFRAALKSGAVPDVCFVKLSGETNEHPGYANLLQGQRRLSEVVGEIAASPTWKDTLLVITYDEYGGRWDHVAPPKIDGWGPGSRIPMMVLSPFARLGEVDHTDYETVSILATIEARWHLQPLNDRDARARPLWRTLK